MEPANPSNQALPPGTRIEEFVIERVLGSGGFGITYLARDVRLDRLVVIKENLPVQFCFRDTHSLTVAPRHTIGEDAENFLWSLENFSKEAAMLASLRHHGIVPVLRSFQALGTAYFVMPFLEGGTLDDLIQERRVEGRIFAEEELVGLLERILDALAYLHDRGIYHRDIKPANILITNEGVPVLIDFGSARQRLSERSMTVVESAGYTPFEQLQSRGNVGPWSDLYSLSGTIEKVITGEAPPKAMDRMRRDPRTPLAQRADMVAIYSATFETPPKANDRAFDDPFEPMANRQDLIGVFSSPFLRGLDLSLSMRPADRWQDTVAWLDGLREIPELNANTAHANHERLDQSASIEGTAVVCSCPHCGGDITDITGTGDWICSLCDGATSVGCSCPRCGGGVEVEQWGLYSCPDRGCGTEFNAADCIRVCAGIRSVECPHCGGDVADITGTGDWICPSCEGEILVSCSCPECGEDVEIEEWGTCLCPTPGCGREFDAACCISVSTGHEWTEWDGPGLFKSHWL